ncbi:DUF2867 domain-containing protein [Kribbella sp. NPDC051770]|uniref:DUF2867 domain-containing protein n=1 Tax=Kribbella sp. NPDC051770 TaxID=3155413 RepID=UPI00343F1569
MRLPTAAHADIPWRIHEITADFQIEDVWALPTPGGPADFQRLIAQFSEANADTPELMSSTIGKFLMAARWKLGELFGWDKDGEGLGRRVPSLKDRLPADLRDGPTGPELDGVPFRPIFLTDNEWAAEIANSTMHGVLHLGWVQDGDHYRGQMAVLVKPNGLRGTAYMALIKPFRYLWVYPDLLRTVGRGWEAGRGNAAWVNRAR